MPFFKFATFLAVVAALRVVIAHTGRATYYYQGGAAGACGVYNPDDAMIVALDKSVFNMDLCGSKIYIVNGDGGVIYAIVADVCEGCGGGNNIDLSSGAFGELSNWNYPEGVITPIYWDWV